MTLNLFVSGVDSIDKKDDKICFQLQQLCIACIIVVCNWVIDYTHSIVFSNLFRMKDQLAFEDITNCSLGQSCLCRLERTKSY
jgi:hypothetical protein